MDEPKVDEPTNTEPITMEPTPKEVADQTSEPPMDPVDMEKELLKLREQMDGKFNETSPKPAKKPLTNSTPTPEPQSSSSEPTPTEPDEFKDAGTDKQTMIMTNYPHESQKDKINIPYIER